MDLQQKAQFRITVFKLAIILSKLLITSQLENDSEVIEHNATTEWHLNTTEINITDRKNFAVDNYSSTDTSPHPVLNNTMAINDTFFQDYSDTSLSNISSIENITYIPVIDETRIPERSSFVPCTCDLTHDSCDVNCCCDDDCTDRDRDAFYGCIPPPVTDDKRYCVSKTIIYDHRRIKEQIVEQNDLLCIIHDHLKERQNYLEPPILTTVAEYQKFVPKPSYSWISIAETVNDSVECTHEMKAGESLYIRTVDGIVTEWKLPTSIFSGNCGAYKAPKYMIDEATTCERVITDVKEDCLHNKWLKASTYYKNFSFVFPKGDTNITVAGTEDDSSIFQCTSDLFCVSVIPSCTYKYNNSIPVQCSSSQEDIPLPDYDANEYTCKNVVSKVRYSVIHDGSAGIRKVNVTFEIITVSSSQIAISQHYSVHYYGTKDKYVFRRSGNPGYLIGHPILAGIISKTDRSSSVVLLSSDSNNWLTIMGKLTNGYCSPSSSDRLPVKFGENMNTGCLYKVPCLQENIKCCSYIQEKVMDFLNGHKNAPSHVGMFGNSDVHNVADWVQIQKEGEPTKPYADAISDGSCSSIVLGMDIKIAYANIGSLANPQPKIIGVLYRYLMSEYILPPCMGPSCNAKAAHTIQLKTSVTFIDASKPAFPTYAKIPVTKISFPHDFFYPLISGYSCSNIGIALLHWSFYIAFVCLTTVF